MFRGCFSKTSGSYLQQDTYPLLSMKYCCKTKETLEAIINFLKMIMATHLEGFLCTSQDDAAIVLEVRIVPLAKIGFGL